MLDRKTRTFEHRAILSRSRVIPRIDAGELDSAGLQHRGGGDHRARAASVPAELADEPPALLEGAKNPRRRAFRLQHPVQHRVGENRVELAIELEVVGADDARVEAAATCGFDHLRRRVDADHLRACGDYPLGDEAIAASEVEDFSPRAGARIGRVGSANVAT